MALIECPECGKKFSDKAAACPNCGYCIKSKGNYGKIIVAVILIAAIVAAGYYFVFYYLHSKPKNMNQVTYDAGVEAVEAAEKAISGDLTFEEISNKLDDLQDKLDGVFTENTSEITENLKIKNDLISLSIKFASNYWEDDTESKQELRESVDALKKDLNMK